MTDDATRELIDAARELLPYLETEPRDALLKMDLSPADRLRAQADQLEAKEAAIRRFRKAMEPFNT